MVNERNIYLGVAAGGGVVVLAMLYILIRSVSSSQSPLLLAAVALAGVEGAILTWIAYRRFRLERAADVARWVRAGSVLTCVVIVLLFIPRLWAVLHH